MLRAFEDKRSWVTQRMANRFPPYSRLRNLAQSTGQMLLEPFGRELENFYFWANHSLENSILNTSDLDQIGGLYKLSLPSNLEWRTRHDGDDVVYLSPTSVKGVLDAVDITLTQAEDNTLEEFWYGLPTRITATEDSCTYLPIISSVSITELSDTAPRRVQYPGKLYISISNNGSFLKNYGGVSVRAVVKLEGRDVYGKDLKERLFFAYNGTVATKFCWSEIDTVETEYIDDTAYIRIDWLPVGTSDLLDPYGLSVSTDREKFRFFALGESDDGYSTLQLKNFAAPDFRSVQDGSDVKDVAYETLLLDSGSTEVEGVSLAVWPHRRWVVVSDDSKLHFYVPAVSSPDTSPLVSRTSEAILQIETDKEWYCPDDTITLDYRITRPFWQVLRTRWSVEKPDGTRKGISSTGAEVTYSNSCWVENTSALKLNKVGFQGDTIDYTPTDSGRYVLYLESTIKNALDGPDTDAFLQVDVKVISVGTETALASIDLPISVGVSASCVFDSYGQPWCINDVGVATRIEFHYDKYLVDYENRAIYTRENYENVEVEV